MELKRFADEVQQSLAQNMAYSTGGLEHTTKLPRSPPWSGYQVDAPLVEKASVAEPHDAAADIGPKLGEHSMPGVVLLSRVTRVPRGRRHRPLPGVTRSQTRRAMS